MAGYKELDSEEESIPHNAVGSGYNSHYQQHRNKSNDDGSNITLDSFFADVDREIQMLRDDQQIMTDTDASELQDDYMEERPSVQGGITFSNQELLPRLPIPKLEETANKLLQCLEALQTPEQKLHAQQQVLEFVKGDGPILQRLLMEYDQTGFAEGTLGSYFEEFWNESSLVPSDDASSMSKPLNLNNPFFMLEDSPDPDFATHPIRRAASLTMAAMKVASTIRNETFLPDTSQNKPLCMDQYKAVFGAARVPHQEDGDDIDVYPSATHIVVMCRNQMYYFQAMWPETGVLAVDEEDLVDILTAIERNSRQTKKHVAGRTCPGVLTTLPRREWAQIRAQLFECDDRNAQYLTIVDSALFVLVLDDEMAPKTVGEAATNLLHGTVNVEHENYNRYMNEDPEHDGATSTEEYGSSRNRWYDKLQIIVCADASAGINFEHTGIDSHTALRVVSDIYAETVVQYLQSITKFLPTKSRIPHIVNAPVERARSTTEHAHTEKHELDVLPKKITFEIPDEVRRTIYHAGTTLGDAIFASDTKVLVFRDYGKKFIAANDMSPDSLVQMSLILAYYKLYGNMVNVYEPVLTKFFFHGRTGAMRSATLPAKILCEIFFDSHSQALAKVALLKSALNIHKRMVIECAAGKGVDRHLHALKCMAEQHGLPMPAFFESEPWKMLNHNVILASNCGNPSLRLYGVSPVVPGGYGIGYIIKDYSIHFCITSRRRQTERFARVLDEVLFELGDLLQKNNLDGQKLSAGGRLNDIIEDIPEGTVGMEESTISEYGDMWGQESKLPSSQQLTESSPRKHLSSPTAPPVVPIRPGSLVGSSPRHFLRDDSSDQSGCRWASETLENNQSATHLMVPLHPMSDDDSLSRDHPAVPRRAPRRSRDRRARAGSIFGSNVNHPSNAALPKVPQRRGWMFTGMSERAALSMEQLNTSGASFEFNYMDRSDRIDRSDRFDLSERSDYY